MRRAAQALADWLTSKDNPFFAKSTANRVWSYFFGRGIIDPVDDIRASNPPSNPALLDALTKDFIDHDFDLRHLMRTIANSRTYQAGIATNEWNEKDTDNFSHAIPRRLTAEQLMDALTRARPACARCFPTFRRIRSAEQLTDPHIGKEGFLDLFGGPSRESACECERRADLSLPQALNLVNGKTISDAVADGERPRRQGGAGGKTRPRSVEELYLASLSRPPTAAELENGAEVFAGPGRRGRAARAQDLLWALSTARHFCTTTDREEGSSCSSFPAVRCHTCEGPTRRELLRAGSLGMLGLNLAQFPRLAEDAQAAIRSSTARADSAARSP